MEDIFAILSTRGASSGTNDVAQSDRLFWNMIKIKLQNYI